MPAGALSLGQVAAKVHLLEIACRRCDRRGRLSIAPLLVEHGSEAGMPDRGPVLAGDCPGRDLSINELCGVCFPQLPALF